MQQQKYIAVENNCAKAAPIKALRGINSPHIINKLLNDTILKINSVFNKRAIIKIFLNILHIYSIDA